MDLTTITREGAQRHGSALAFSCDGREQTYEQLYDRSCRLANALAALGVAPGERVATLSDNCPETIEMMVGIALGGYVRTALYTHNTSMSNVQLLDHVEASILLVEARHHALLAEALKSARTVRHVVVCGGAAADGTLDYEQLLNDAPSSDPAVALAPGDPHIIRFSAGTTGMPKGILHSVSGWRAVAAEMALVMPPLDHRDRYLAAGPLSHAAMLPMLAVLAARGAVVAMRAFDPRLFLELVERQRCTTTLLVPTMIQMIVGLPEAQKADVSSLRAVIYGAAPINERNLSDALGLWGNIMYQMYGQSEAVPLTVLTPADHAGERRGSAGRPTPNTVVRIVDEEGDDVAPGEVGEIAVRTPAAMTEIWRDATATQQRILSDGSVLTRDMGRLDDEGFLFIADRKDDMIISGGFNIWPTELENALASHPAVSQVAVIGVLDPKWGETPKAVVVLREDQQATPEELIEWSRERVGPVKRVTSVDFADELPVSATGKVLRREVKARYREDKHSPAGA